MALPKNAMTIDVPASKAHASSKRMKIIEAPPKSKHKSRKEKASSSSSKKAHNGSVKDGSSHHTSHCTCCHTSHDHVYYCSPHHQSDYTSYQSSEPSREDPLQRFVQDPRDVKSWTVQDYDSHQRAALDQHQKELDYIVKREY